MITRPDEYKHNNDAYAIVDNNNVRGGTFGITSLTVTTLGNIPEDKREINTLLYNATDNKIYYFTGADITDTNWENVSNWSILSGTSYTHPTGFSREPSSPLSGAVVMSQLDITSEGHVAGVVTRSLTPEELGAATSSHTHAYQPIDADLTAIAAISATSGLLKKTASNTWSLDTSTYLTQNQTITLGGDVVGSGTSSINVTVADDSHTHTSSTISGLVPSGGTTGQTLKKNSSTNYDYSWKDDTTNTAAPANIIVSVADSGELNTYLTTLNNDLGGNNIVIYLDAAITYTISSPWKTTSNQFYNGSIRLTTRFVDYPNRAVINIDAQYITGISNSKSFVFELNLLTINKLCIGAFISGGNVSVMSCTLNNGTLSPTLFDFQQSYANLIITDCEINDNYSSTPSSIVYAGNSISGCKITIANCTTTSIFNVCVIGSTDTRAYALTDIYNSAGIATTTSTGNVKII